MDSLNVPVPGPVRRLAADLEPALAAFDRRRDRPSLVLKRFEGHVDRVAVREALAGAPAVEARVVGVDHFERPVRGPGPVVYLAVESPGLRRLHRRLVDRFGAVEGLEGEAYVPHVTLARGDTARAAGESSAARAAGESSAARAAGESSAARAAGESSAAERLAARDVDPVEWTVSRLECWDAEHREAVGTVSLPAGPG